MDYARAPLTLADTTDWSALTKTVADFDGTAEIFAPQDLAEELGNPALDPEFDTVGFRAPSGQFVGFGQLWHRTALVDGRAVVNLVGGVHPEHRGRGIGSAICAQLEARIVEESARRHPGAPALARSEAGVQVGAQRHLLERRGYTEARYFHEMVRKVGSPVAGVDPGPGPDPGIRAYRDGDSEAVRRAHEAAFARHWMFAPRSAEEWRTQLIETRTFRPQLSFVRPGVEGRIDGYVLSYQFQPAELWIGILGVRSEARGHGLGRSLLAAAVRTGQAAGFTEVALGVDTDNVTGAGRLYAAAGFTVARTSVAYLKRL